MKTRFVLLPALAVSVLAASPAAANYSGLTSAVDFSAVITALLAVAAVIVGVLIVRKGIRFVLGALR